MNKKSRSIYSILAVTLFLLINLTTNVGAKVLNNKGLTAVTPIPQKIQVSVGDKIGNYAEYSNFRISVYNINTDVGPAYCLEIEKDYPDDHTFNFIGKPAKEVIGIMAAGYPEKSPSELGLKTNDEAYYATQVAIWCVTEGYNINRLRCNDKAMLNAIKSIYNERKNYNENDLEHLALEYYISDDIQRIVVYMMNILDDNSGITDEVKPEVPVVPEDPKDENTGGIDDSIQDIIEDENVINGKG